MSKSNGLNELKGQTKKIQKAWKGKLSYLSQLVSSSGAEGAVHWLKSHHQIEDLNAAVDELIKSSQEDSFYFSQVETTLSSFVLPEQDLQQAEWYKTADNLLKSFITKLSEQQKFDRNLLLKILNELKFISEADEFHQLYRIESIQQKVTQVYQNLQQVLADHKKIEQQKLKQQKENDKLKIIQAESEKAQAETKKQMLESVKIKEKRIAIMEEKKRKIAEKELLESQAKIDFKKSELEAKKAESERQAKLQDAYIDLQLEEKITNWSINDIFSILQKKLEDQSYSPEIQVKVSQIIEDIKITQ